MAVLPPSFLDCVVAIGFGKTKSKRRYSATGFIYGRSTHENETNQSYWLFLVTNRHVFENENEIWLRFNTIGNEAAKEIKITLITKKGETLFKTHPNQEIDLAVISLNANYLKQLGIRFGCFCNDKHVTKIFNSTENEICEGDSVFVLGFPMGLIGKERNFVIVRQGIIARIGDTLLQKSNEFLIDTTIFPGNSGGPVVFKPELGFIKGTKGRTKASLVGVVSSYLTYRDVAISGQTNQPRVIFEENSGLTSVVPIDYLDELIETGYHFPEKITSNILNNNYQA
jgi:hypothetical protein